MGSRPDNIAFTSSATNSFARALSSIPFKKGDCVLIANEDYISNQLALLSIKERFGINLLRVPSTEKGGVDLNALREMAIKHRPVLISLTHVPTNSGLVQPAVEVGKICNELNIPFLLDACQSAGQLHLDVREIGCDFLSATFRKFLRGPRGAGFLYVSDKILQQNWYPLFIDMKGADWTERDHFRIQKNAQRFEDWELPYSLLLGSSAASEYVNKIGIQTIEERNRELMRYLKNTLSTMGWHTLDRGDQTCSILTIHFPKVDPKVLHRKLRDQKINTSVSLGNYALIDFESKNVDWALRISPHYYNTEEEIDLLTDALDKITGS
ncbi:MAG: aminotransferase class V-fold PLP-dependent enzyme [Cyclobacteriaceae bacterium]